MLNYQRVSLPWTSQRLRTRLHHRSLRRSHRSAVHSHRSQGASSDRILGDWRFVPMSYLENRWHSEETTFMLSVCGLNFNFSAYPDLCWCQIPLLLVEFLQFVGFVPHFMRSQNHIFWVKSLYLLLELQGTHSCSWNPQFLPILWAAKNLVISGSRI